MAKFISTVLEPQDWVELRVIKPSNAKKLWSRAGELHKLIGKLRSLNRDGFNIYFGPNPRKNYGKSGDESVDLCRCLFVDFDNLKPADGQSLSDDIALARISEAKLPKPTAIINSGHGIHAYWKLFNPLEPGFWSDTQRRLNATLQSDPSIQNPERLMRLPGFINTKAEPYVKCEVVYVEPNSKYDVDGFAELLVELPTEPAPAPAKPIERPGQMEHKARAMLYAARWEGISEGQGRNNAAYKHACQLRRDFDLPESESWEILSEWNLSNNPPLSDTELRQAFDSANKYGKRPIGTKLNKSCRQAGRHEPKDPLDEMDEYIEGVISGQLRTIEWPWIILGDGTQALQPGTLTIISGGPGAAKSLFTMQAIRWWLENGESISYYGMEGVRSRYMMRCLAQLACNSELIKNKYVKAHGNEIKQLREKYELELSAFSKCLTVMRDMKADYLDQISAWVRGRAKGGVRLIIVDPITLALRSGKAWEADQRFVREINNIAQDYLCNVIIVTHPEKGVEDPSLQNLAGGASYSRFSDNVFTIKMHEEKKSTIAASVGRCEVQHNQTITVAKARDGSIVGKRLAYLFDSQSLTTEELGIITKEK